MPRIILLAVSLLVTFAGTGGAVAKSERPGYFKIAERHREVIDFGGTKSGQVRQVLYIPLDFGNLIAITPVGDSYVFWFQDEKRQIRNVYVRAELDLNLTTMPVIIQREGRIVSQETTTGY